jgi:hypothetical protein
MHPSIVLSLTASNRRRFGANLFEARTSILARTHPSSEAKINAKYSGRKLAGTFIDACKGGVWKEFAGGGV